MTRILLFILSLGVISSAFSQAVPAPEENIPFLVTFGKEASSHYGDDDYCQTFFFTIPKNNKKPFYIRIFDPNIGGEFDEIIGSENSETSFELYGGKGAISNLDAQEADPIGNFKSGNLLHSKKFSNDSKYDDKWYTIGPLNPQQGELSEQYFGHVFKLICEGSKGNDGNLYRYFLSTSPSSNVPVAGGNAFTFEYTIRLHSDPNQTSHIYPFIDDDVISIKQTNFDCDDDGDIKLFSVATKNHSLELSSDDEKVESIYEIKPREKGTSIDIQLIKGEKKIENNNIVFYVTNQYGETLPFFAAPIGGIPKYKGKMVIKSMK